MSHIRFWLLSAAAILGGLGCGSSLPVGPATIPNEVDTLTLHALTGTDITQPSAIDLIIRRAVRTDRAAEFDLAFDIDSAGVPKIFPAGALGFPAEPGVQVMEDSFEEILEAPEDEYESREPLAIVQGTVFVARSRFSSVNCTFIASIARFGKFRVLSIDTAERTVTLQTLINANCGFRSLAPGLPDN